MLYAYRCQLCFLSFCRRCRALQQRSFEVDQATYVYEIGFMTGRNRLNYASRHKQ